MQKRASIGLLATAVIAIVSILAYAEVKAECVSPNCFISPSGYKVEIVPPFPITDSVGNTVFNYMITGTKTGVTGVSHIDIFIPVCDPNAIAINNTSPDSYSTYAGGIGEPSTGFGLGDLQDYVLKWNITYSGLSPRNFQVTITGSEVSDALTSMMLKLGKVAPEFGRILGPSCYVPPPPTVQTDATYTTDFSSLRCTFDRYGIATECINLANNAPVPLIPVEGNMTCTVTNPETGLSKTLNIESISEACEIIGGTSPACCYQRVVNGGLRWVGTCCP